MEKFYDEEQLIRDIEETFKANLNTQIACVNADKEVTAGQPLFIEDIPSERYIFETLDKRVLNFKGFFIIYGLVDTPIRDVQVDNFVEDVIVTFRVATWDLGEKERSATLYRLLRYRQALKLVIMRNPDMFRGYAKPMFGSLKPSDFPYDNNNVIINIGIDIKASITAN